tara:strand:- start:365 stop:1009 length:645 start_codon:yes stop_codon:yes gene_type:complete
MKAPIKVVMLPTGLPILKGQLAILDGKTSIYSFDMKDEHPAKAQHIYITVSQDVEPIKNGDLYYDSTLEQIMKAHENSDHEIYIVSCRKIIATTDPKLTYNHKEVYDVQSVSMEGSVLKPIPQIQQSFIEEFVANPNRKWEVEYEQEYVDCYTEDRVRRFYGDCKLKLNQDNEVSITSIEGKMYSLSDLERLGDYAYMNAKSTWDWKKFIKENL